MPRWAQAHLAPPCDPWKQNDRIPVEMKVSTSTAGVLLTIAIVLLPEAAAAQQSGLAANLEAILADPSLDSVTVAAAVRLADSGELVYEHHGDQRLPPGSAEKLLTSAAALADLGPDYRFHTAVLAAAPPAAGVISGDLYLKGTGDPTLFPGRFDDLAQQLVDQGIREVRGGLAADDSYFDAERLGFEWSQQDENFAYAAPISALSVSPDADFNTGGVQVDLAPGPAVGAPGAVGLTPPTSVIELDNDLVTTAYAADVFRSALDRHGLHVDGPTRAATTPAGAIELASLNSTPLADLLYPFLKLSNNPIAEILVKSMGQHDAHQGSWSAGLAVIRGYLAARGLDPGGVQLVDGSGLSTADLIAPDDLTLLLASVQDEPWFDQWYAALPIAGEPEHLVGGTLATRMTDTPAAGNLHGKTGTLTTTSVLAGFVTSGTGQRLVFSVVENGFIGQPPREVEDAFAVALATS
jgi:serine-type D-Ala-D-Ala carboxypeptidase/endopeptidase (penicillin-binding protein 4)